MKFAAFITYADDPARIAEMRPAHRAYLSTLLDEGKLAVAGPFTDGSGALLVYEAETAEAARALAHADPFSQAAVFKHVELRPWTPVFFNPVLLSEGKP